MKSLTTCVILGMGLVGAACAELGRAPHEEGATIVESRGPLWSDQRRWRLADTPSDAAPRSGSGIRRLP